VIYRILIEPQSRAAGWKTLFKRPSLGAILLALIPFAAMCFSVPLWDRAEPLVLGIPFNLFWLISWIALSSLCLWGAYRLETKRDKKDGETE